VKKFNHKPSKILFQWFVFIWTINLSEKWNYPQQTVEKVKRSIRTTFFLTVVGVEGKED
jgi:hypothetical protein